MQCITAKLFTNEYTDVVISEVIHYMSQKKTSHQNCLLLMSKIRKLIGNDKISLGEEILLYEYKHTHTYKTYTYVYRKYEYFPPSPSPMGKGETNIGKLLR